ncbi:hypothetical protein RJ639_042698, partial [Escallonia herrerae]
MGEETLSENRGKASKFADQNQISKGNNAKGNGYPPKPRSSWGSNIVKGFSAERKTKLQGTLQNKRVPLTSSAPSHLRVKRSFISDLSCSANTVQVHPQATQVNRTKSSESRDLLLELDHLRSLLQESKVREAELQAEFVGSKGNSRVLELERELQLKNNEIDDLVLKVGLLESEKANLSEQLMSLTCVLDGRDDLSRREGHGISTAPPSRDVDMEVVELRRLNMELKLQRRNLACRLSSMESQLATLAKDSERDTAEKIKVESSLLRRTNEDLCKQVEGLQMNRLNEVEELVYLRWVNSCLRNELQTFSSMSADKSLGPKSSESCSESFGLSSCPSDNNSEDGTKKLDLIKRLWKWPISDEYPQTLGYQDNTLDRNWEALHSPRRRHSISASKGSAEDLILRKRRQSDGFMEKQAEPLLSQNYDLIDIQSPQFLGVFQETKSKASSEVEKRALRIPNPPPRPSCTVSSGQNEGSAQFAPPPPPPPPPPPTFMGRSPAGTVQRAPQVVEFYHSLMKRDSRKDSVNGGISDGSVVPNVRSSMIGEIENRSSHLLAIKADVETQGDFVNTLIREVNNAAYQDIEDVGAFVKWLDEELCFLVDETAVLKHFDWPEKKADTLREAAFAYRDLKKLEYEVANYKDDCQLPCDISLKKTVALSEKMERIVYSLLRTRESLMRHCKEFHIPTAWMLDNGILSKTTPLVAIAVTSI